MNEFIQVLRRLRLIWTESPGAAVPVVDETGGILPLTAIGCLHKAGFVRYDPVRHEVRATESFRTLTLHDICCLVGEQVTDPLTVCVLKDVSLGQLCRAFDDFDEAMARPVDPDTPENRRRLKDLRRRMDESEKNRLMQAGNGKEQGAKVS